MLCVATDIFKGPTSTDEDGCMHTIQRNVFLWLRRQALSHALRVQAVGGGSTIKIHIFTCCIRHHNISESSFSFCRYTFPKKIASYLSTPFNSLSSFGFPSRTCPYFFPFYPSPSVPVLVFTSSYISAVIAQRISTKLMFAGLLRPLVSPDSMGAIHWVVHVKHFEHL